MGASGVLGQQRISLREPGVNRLKLNETKKASLSTSKSFSPLKVRGLCSRSARSLPHCSMPSSKVSRLSDACCTKLRFSDRNEEFQGEGVKAAVVIMF